jgi:hypothetical protein
LLQNMRIFGDGGGRSFHGGEAPQDCHHRPLGRPAGLWPQCTSTHTLKTKLQDSLLSVHLCCLAASIAARAPPPPSLICIQPLGLSLASCWSGMPRGVCRNSFPRPSKRVHG